MGGLGSLICDFVQSLLVPKYFPYFGRMCMASEKESLQGAIVLAIVRVLLDLIHERINILGSYDLKLRRHSSQKHSNEFGLYRSDLID